MATVTVTVAEAITEEEAITVAEAAPGVTVAVFLHTLHLAQTQRTTATAAVTNKATNGFLTTATV